MWLNKLEEKFGRYAIPNLPKIIVLLYAVGFVIANISPRLYSLLELNPYLKMCIRDSSRIIVDRHDVRIRECLTDFFDNTLTNDMVR